MTSDRVLHSDILPDQDCDGEVIELPEDGPTRVKRVRPKTVRTVSFTMEDKAKTR